MTDSSPKSAPGPKIARFDWLDGLRGLAALAIVVVHNVHFYLVDSNDYPNLPPHDQLTWASIFLPIYRYGHYAVQLFWVISGFVFLHVYQRRAVTAGQFTLARVSRLYPLHLITLLFVGALQAYNHWYFGKWQIYGNNDLRHFVLQLFMVSNSTKLANGLSYNGPIWSVSVELVSYVMFFFALPFLRRFGTLATLVLTAACASIAWYPNYKIPILAQGVFGCAAYFFFGSFLYRLYLRFSTKVALLFGFAALFAAGAVVAHFAGIFLATLVSAAAALVLLAAALDRVHVAPTAMSFLGDRSYALYLVHVPMQMLFLTVVDMVALGDRSLAEAPWLLPVFMVLSIVASHVVHIHFEKPIGAYLRKFTRRLGKPAAVKPG